jgi:hypothetical protein
MKLFAKCLVAVCLFALFLSTTPTSFADENNNKSILTFTAPFEVPGVGAQVLPAGTYIFKLLDSPSNRHIVQIFSQDGTHLYTTILAVPNYRARSTDNTVMTFKERAQGEPEAIRTWFYPGHRMGEEFVYNKSKALDLAKVVNEPVLYTPVEIATVEDLQTAPVEAITPTGDVVTLAEVVKAEPVAEPVAVAKMEQPALPNTASNLPLLACFGVLALGAAGVMKFTS